MRSNFWDAEEGGKLSRKNINSIMRRNECGLGRYLLDEKLRVRMSIIDGLGDYGGFRIFLLASLKEANGIWYLALGATF